MRFEQDYFDSQLDAIQEFYHNLTENNEDQVSLSDAIVLWFANGHAEEFREAYLEDYAALAQ